MLGEDGWAVTICNRQWKPIQNARGEIMHAFIPLGDVHRWIPYRRALKRARRKARLIRAAAEGRLGQERCCMTLTSLDQFLVPAYTVLRDPAVQTYGDFIRAYRALPSPHKAPLTGSAAPYMRELARKFIAYYHRRRQRRMVSFGWVIHADGTIGV
jgi:hypothetical protein